MIYGLYLSATGVLTNSHKQDVIANNLANAETVGFKRSMALFQQRRAEAHEGGRQGTSNPMLDDIGGGLLLAPTYVDHSRGQIERSSSNLDLAIEGKGFFAVRDGAQTRLTRNGSMMLDREGFLILADGSNHRILDDQRQPIQIANIPQSQIQIASDGVITAGEEGIIGRIGVFAAPDEARLRPRGGTLLSHPNAATLPLVADPQVLSGFIENSNVDPTTELTQLINAQRQLEANANMIRYQDQTLGKAVNEVGKIG